MSQPGIWSSTWLCKQNPESPQWHVFCWVTWRQLRNKNITDKVTMITRLFHSTKFTCHANLQYCSFTSKFRRKFSQMMQIVKTCVAPFTKMHSVGFSEIIPYHVPWVVSYFSWTQCAHMSTRHLPLPHYRTCLSLLIRIKLQQLFFGRWGFKSRSRCQTAGGRLHDSDCRDPVWSLTNKCAVMPTAAMSVDVKSKESSVSADRILKANADLQQLMPSGSFKIFDCTLKTASCYT